MWAGYCGAISFVDHLLGTLLAALIETGRLDDTLVVFTSDHGELLGSHGMLFKGALLFEELVRVPLLVKPPRRTSPHRTAQLVSHVDLVPSILAWCGVAPPAALQGRDLRGLTEGGDTPVREGLALEYHSANWGERPAPLRGWVTREAKYVEGPDGPEELYDLRADPNEADNRVGDPASAGTRLRLRTALASWLGESGDRWPAIPRPAREIPRKPGIRQ
jgi:arylsulfatase A-like enzyme